MKRFFLGALRSFGTRALIFCVVLASLPLFAHALQDLTATATTSGLSLHQSFYDELAGSILAENEGRSAVYDGSTFVPYFDQVDTEFTQIEALLLSGFEQALAALALILPGIWRYIVLLLHILIGLVCGTGPTAELDLPDDSIYATFAVQDIQVDQTATGHRFDLVLSDVGVISQVEIEVGLGSCTDSASAVVKFVYPSLSYQVDATFLAGGGVQYTAQMIGQTPAIQMLFDGDADLTAETLWGWANQGIGGDDLEDKIQEWATVGVLPRLQTMLESWWTPYLAQSGFIMDLSGSRQNARYTENQVFGTVGPALFAPLRSDLPDQKVRVVFDNFHSHVPAHSMALCADDGFEPGPAVLPNFDSEISTAEGSYHTSYKTFEHRIAAGIRSAVGLRDEDKPGSEYIVEHELPDLVPEGAASTIAWLFGNVASPVRPIPLGLVQQRDLVDTPVPGGSTLGQTGLDGLKLRVRICEMSRPTMALPFGSLGGSGTVQHDVMLEATIENGTGIVLQETFEAVFVGELRLSKVPLQDSIELRTIRADLVSLVNQNGLEWDKLTQATPFAAAPVTLFLHAFLGDNSLPFGFPDSRIHYLVEGLVGPLVERAAHGMVVLPGLDFPAFDGPRQGHSAIAENRYGGGIGLDFDHPALCAQIVRWGQTQAVVGGFPSGEHSMLSVEVDWIEAPDTTGGVQTGTNVHTSYFPSTTPSAQTNPSRWDGGYLSASYMPAPGYGDETRVMNASGNRIGDFLPGISRHYVAATAAAYRYLRETFGSDPRTSFELRPYRRLEVPLDCQALFPGPIRQMNPPNPGFHHDDPFDSHPDVYEALTFESRLSCAGQGSCDGVRVIAMWTAPLFQACPGPSGPLGGDIATFDTVPGTLRVPPSKYDFVPDTCGLGGIFID